MNLISEREKKREESLLKASHTSSSTRDSVAQSKVNLSQKQEHRVSQLTTQTDSGRETALPQEANADFVASIGQQLERDLEAIEEELIEDCNLLGDIRVDPETELLAFVDFCRISKLLKKYTHPTMVPSLKVLIDRRRELIDTDEERYRELALLFSECEENFTQNVSEVVLDHFGVEQQTFFESYNRGIVEDPNNEKVL